MTRAIALDSQYALAYSLRSKVRLQLLQEQQEEDDEGGGEGVGKEGDAQRAQALHSAAEDALLGKNFSLFAGTFLNETIKIVFLLNL